MKNKPETEPKKVLQTGPPETWCCGILQPIAAQKCSMCHEPFQKISKPEKKGSLSVFQTTGLMPV